MFIRYNDQSVINTDSVEQLYISSGLLMVDFNSPTPSANIYAGSDLEERFEEIISVLQTNTKLYDCRKPIGEQGPKTKPKAQPAPKPKEE